MKKPHQQNQKTEPRSPNLPNIKLYLTKKNNSIEARAAALQQFSTQNPDKFRPSGHPPSTDANSARSNSSKTAGGIESERQTKLGDTAKGLQ